LGRVADIPLGRSAKLSEFAAFLTVSTFTNKQVTGTILLLVLIALFIALKYVGIKLFG
jgi:hypothetical protein